VPLRGCIGWLETAVEEGSHGGSQDLCIATFASWDLPPPPFINVIDVTTYVTTYITTYVTTYVTTYITIPPPLQGYTLFPSPG